ncbi:tRNA uracil 4-sulfurtransferase ThiI [Mycoplasma miroungirhinis]|uniref:Probable tRNA sulfurtransferase n=1 Tax=Mycoplasma miroungirhinis TaxID=754516 RepID=A0A6M4JGB0_9MOLU|nr:tRNA uracil 4-sulfurtransferase ThiI [Mycoplasma miroungirhinis]QJR44082.1 tRNA 4-thiouridine(8) synthase ThiI [Mycoplasma miroungirhinis]
MKKILLRYGELTLKGKNRINFIKVLENNLIKKMEGEVIVTFDRAFISFTENNIEKLKYIFGLSSFSIVEEIDTSWENIVNRVLNEAKQTNFQSFRIQTKRSDKKFMYSSQETNEKLGAVILKTFTNSYVQLKNPDLTIYVEIRANKSFVFSNYTYTRGGMPVGISGKTLHLMSGGIDSPVAANLMQKRGLIVDFINFITPPHTDYFTTKKVEDLINEITKYQLKSTLFQINYTKVMNYLALVSNQKYKITLMRRSFYRIAEAIANKFHYFALSNGENLAQVASQTLESINVIQEVTNLPIFRPLVSFDKNDTIKIAEQIHTYEISIRRACETCELFAPKEPITKPNLQEVLKLEQELPRLKELETEAIENVQIFHFHN